MCQEPTELLLIDCLKELTWNLRFKSDTLTLNIETRRHIDKRKLHTWQMEQSSLCVQHQSFQLSLLCFKNFSFDQLHQNDGEKDARTGTEEEDCNKVKADDDEPDRHCLDKFFICEQSDCDEKSGDTQSLKSTDWMFRTAWREKKKEIPIPTQRRVLKDDKGYSTGCLYRETCPWIIRRPSVQGNLSHQDTKDIQENQEIQEIQKTRKPKTEFGHIITTYHQTVFLRWIRSSRS